MKTNHHSIAYLMLCLLLALINTNASALDGGAESLRQTGKAFASVAREVSPSVVFYDSTTRLEIE